MNNGLASLCDKCFKKYWRWEFTIYTLPIGNCKLCGEKLVGDDNHTISEQYFYEMMNKINRPAIDI
jgi:hypothetical protein